MPPDLLTPELQTEYLALQQEADFALWTAREANAELRDAYARHLRGECPAPGADLQARVLQAAETAEEKYRKLRSFLRLHLGGRRD